MPANTKLDVRLPKRVLYPELVSIGLAAATNASAPFSDFKVGCALITWDGRVYTGVNTENPGLGLTVHGEMSAINAAIADGALRDALADGLTSQNWIRAISVVPLRCYEAWPCGHCREFIMGFGGAMDIIVPRENAEPLSRRMSRLLPRSDKVAERIEDAATGRLLTLANARKRFDGIKSVKLQPAVEKLHIDPTTAKRNAYPALIELAREAAARSYAPYSKRPAGAALWLHDGRVVTGSRLENVGYTLSNEPEVQAIGCAVSEGLLHEAIASGVKVTEFVRAIAYVVPGRPRAFPSGSSRQCMCDFGLNIDIIADGGEGSKPVVMSLAKLLPGAFVPDVLSYWTQG